MNTGKFIAFEGIDGSGKGVQINMLAARFAELGQACHVTREPSDSPTGALIRRVLSGEIKTDARALALLFAADRADHLLGEDGVARRIKAGETVITDRCYFSSYAYHAADGMDPDWIISVNAASARVLRPDVTIFLDITAEEAMRRISRRGSRTELFEKEEMLRLVREKYFEAFERMKGEERVVIIDAGADEGAVAGRVWGCVNHFFPKPPFQASDF